MEINDLKAVFYKDVCVPGEQYQFNQGLALGSGLLESLKLMARDALNRNESCGGHFRVRPDRGGEARDDANYMYVSRLGVQGRRPGA